MDPLLGTCSLTELRQRRSHKWRNYPPAVLPAFVAEMDFDLAGPITAAVTSALATGDCGYAHLPGVGYAPPQASFLAWLDCRDLGLGDDPSAVFLERGSVALGHGPGSGTEGHGFARLNMGASPGLLAEAVRRMAAAR